MSPKTFMKALLMLPCLVSAAGPTGKLNDTGQTQCVNADGSGLEPCSYENTGKGSNYPGQDGRFGRDAEALHPQHTNFKKPEGSGGNGGFAFTPLDVNGKPIALELKGEKWVPSDTPRCIWDRVTNLIWEVKTDDDGLQDKDWTYSWKGNVSAYTCPFYSYNYDNGGFITYTYCNTDTYIEKLNAAGVCPVAGAGAWRLPDRRELLSIVDYDHVDPAIDSDYFPHTKGISCCTNDRISYWTNDMYMDNRGWDVGFRYGDSFPASDPGYTRLVRSGK